MTRQRAGTGISTVVGCLSGFVTLILVFILAIVAACSGATFFNPCGLK